jgi:hypothetical protein
MNGNIKSYSRNMFEIIHHPKHGCCNEGSKLKGNHSIFMNFKVKKFAPKEDPK